MKYFTLTIFLFSSFFAKAQFSQTMLQQTTVPSPYIRLVEVDNFNKSLPHFNLLSNQQKEILYYTNVARSQPKYFWDSIVNPILYSFPTLKGSYSKSLYKDLMSSGVLPMFTLHPNLIKASQFHSADMANTGIFSHTSSNGKSFSDRLEGFGVVNTYAAENISMGQQAIILSIVMLYLDIDIPSLGHRNTLLSKQYQQVGIGYAVSNNKSFYITQDFSSTIN